MPTALLNADVNSLPMGAKSFPGFSLSEAEIDFLEKLAVFEAPFLEEKLLADSVFPSSQAYQDAFNEFKKYVALSRFFGNDLAMASTHIDNIWHQFILFTKEYHAFCELFLGKYLHHSPATSGSPISRQMKENLVKRYTCLFGEMPEIWNRAQADCMASCGGTCCNND